MGPRLTREPKHSVNTQKSKPQGRRGGHRAGAAQQLGEEMVHTYRWHVKGRQRRPWPGVRSRATRPSGASEDRGRSERGAPRNPGAAPLCCGSCTRPLSCDWQIDVCLPDPGRASPSLSSAPGGVRVLPSAVTPCPRGLVQTGSQAPDATDGHVTHAGGEMIPHPGYCVPLNNDPTQMARPDAQKL